MSVKRNMRYVCIQQGKKHNGGTYGRKIYYVYGNG